MEDKTKERKMECLAYLVCLFATVTSTLGQTPQKTWVFAFHGNRRPFNFIDEDGIMKGGDLDLINDVCTIAGKKCQTTLQPREECTRTVNGRLFPGRGIMAGWFDVCASYVSSAERVNAMTFSNPIRTASASFTVLKGNPKGFDPLDLSKFTVGHFNGGYTNVMCMVRLGLGKPAKTVIISNGVEYAKELLFNGTIDALFTQRNRFPDLEVLPTRFHCDLDGVGMMVKKGSTFPDWWNPAFDQYYRSGAYNDMCDNINKKYGGFKVEQCLPRPTS